jgi:hypothetical protein
VKMPDKLYLLIYRICDEYANEMDPFDRWTSSKKVIGLRWP